MMPSPSQWLGNGAVSHRSARKRCRLPQNGSETMPYPSERLRNDWLWDDFVSCAGAPRWAVSIEIAPEAVLFLSCVRG
jgi:hypothetical protein